MRILVSEDDKTTALVLQRALTQLGHIVTLTSDGAEALRSLDEGQFRLIISDWMMPGMDGLQLCKRVRQNQEAAYVYIIVVTARNGREDRLEALRAGADDFLTKPLDRDELAARLEVAHRILGMQDMLQRRSAELEELQVELKLANAMLADLATTDSLTGLKNHGHFREALQSSVAHATRTGTAFSLAMLDVDFFKRYNDTHGHPAGNEVLLRVAHVLRDNAREYDMTARYGGEEFVILLADTDRQDSMLFGERLLNALQQTEWPNQPVTVSIGISTFCLDTVSADGLLEQADRALYQAKRQGRNRVIHSSDVDAEQMASARSASIDQVKQAQTSQR